MTKTFIVKEKIQQCFSPSQAIVLMDVVDIYDDVVKVSDFTELKEIVRELAEEQKESRKGINRLDKTMQELAEAQKRTEVKVEELAGEQKESRKSINRLDKAMQELAEAQRITAVELRELKEEHKETRMQLGGLSMAVGYSIEDRAMPYMSDFARKVFGVTATAVDRRNFVYENGSFDEINIYCEGQKNGGNAYVIGECKAQPGIKDAEKFRGVLKRLRENLKGEIYPFIVGYVFNPEVEAYLSAECPEIKLLKSYEFELKYKKAEIA